MSAPSKYPAVWCDFNACGWSGNEDDTCFYVLDQKRLVELGSKADDRVFLFMEDSADGRQITGVEGELVDAADGLIARPLNEEYYHGNCFW